MALLNVVSGQKPREIAARVLQRRATGDEFTETLLERAWAGATLSSVDRGLCQELVHGVVRWQATLDWLIAQKTRGRTQKTALQNLLRLGLYQIFWLDRIPDHAAVHETVELAKRSGFGPQAGFVNAVLRGYLREVDSTRKSLDQLKSLQPALGWSHPDWLVDRWRQRWGGERTRQLLEWNNTPPRTYARVNTLKTDAGKLLERWRTENVEYDFCRRDWFGENLVFELKAHPPLSKLSSCQEGLFYIQDPSTLLAANELGPVPGEAILDLCAAPGGKTTYLAQLVCNEARIVAADVSNDRLKLLQENCIRLGVNCVEAVLSAVLFPPPHEPALRSRRGNEADSTDSQGLPPPHVGGYGSGVQSANLGWGNSHPGPLPLRGGEGESPPVGLQPEAEHPESATHSAAARRAGSPTNLGSFPKAVPLSHRMGEGSGVRALEESQPPLFHRQYDRVLVDAPCSNTGVMRRRVDLRWRIAPEEIQRLRATQLELLRLAASGLKSGGVLVYSTCSLEPEENRGVLQEFLSEHAGLKVVRERELLPMVDAVDGAFVATLHRS
jgi:16S rRNA (cytosine967-C5)-methyltransferase